MKILHNLDNSHRGGIQEMILRLYLWSAHEHHFWAADGSMAAQMRQAGMKLWPGGPPPEEHYDVVVGHTVGGWSNNGLADYAHAHGAKFIECMHSIATTPTDPARIDAFVAVSQLAISQNTHLHPYKRQVIYPPVDCQALRDFERAQRDETDSKPHIGRLSRLVEEKRPAEFALLAREFPACTWLMAGDGPEMSRISTSDNLFLVGWILDLPRFYGSLDLFVFPTRDECACVSVAQAQAAGVPVICQDIPALRETTGGLATFCNSHNDFYQAINRWLARPADFADQNRRAQDWARRMFDYPITIGAWDTLCEAVSFGILP